MQLFRGVTSFQSRFEFFESETLCDNSFKSNIPDREIKEDDEQQLELFDDFDPYYASSGFGLLCFGDSKGTIATVDRDMRVFKFKSHSHR